MALASKRTRKPKKMAAGGTVTDQTDILLAKGGMMDDGSRVDPVSGNDVPVGSLQEEVRDDVPAMLSEGEFVFPADVVRYIGLERLMKIRDDAKTGLARMEDIGQMGNADSAPMADEAFQQDDVAFESEIDSIIGEVDGNVPQAFADGGVVTGSVYRNPMSNPMVDVRMYQHADGRIIYITYINNKPTTPIPQGFVEKAKSTEQKVTVTPTTATGAGAVTTSGGGSSSYNPFTGGDSDMPGGQGVDYDAEAAALNMMALGENLSKIPTIATKILGAIATKAGQMSADKQIDAASAAIQAYHDIAKNDMGLKSIMDAKGNIRSIATKQGVLDFDTAWLSEMQKEMGRERAASVVSGETSLAGSEFASRSEAEAVAEYGWGSDEHFDAISRDFDSNTTVAGNESSNNDSGGSSNVSAPDDSGWGDTSYDSNYGWGDTGYDGGYYGGGSSDSYSDSDRGGPGDSGSDSGSDSDSDSGGPGD